MELQESKWDKLRKPLPISELDIIVIQSEIKSGEHKGMCMWAVYPPVETIRKRLDNVLGPEGWNFRIINVQERDIASGDTIVSVYGSLDIGGVIREDCGTDFSCESYGGKYYKNESAHKSAVSRALTRCAKAFGIGDEANNYHKMFTKDKYTKPDLKKEMARYATGDKPADAKQKPNPGKLMTEAQRKILGNLKEKLFKKFGGGEKNKEKTDQVIKEFADAQGIALKTITSDEAETLINFLKSEYEL